MSDAPDPRARANLAWLALPLVAVVGGGLWIAQLSSLAPNGGAGVPVARVTLAAPSPAPAPTVQDPLPDAAATAVGGTARLVDPTWAASVAEATGIPERAVLAYAGAALTIAASIPECGLGWSTLAALGYVETAHGSHGGSALLASGVVSPAIIGPALDGVEFDAVSDTDGGALDGDTRWDHAVGPLQFIPDTWSRWATDADGDGIPNPQQLDDAALTAARYLCHSGSMTDAAGWRAAVSCYNHSESYVDSVADIANYYSSAAGG